MVSMWTAPSGIIAGADGAAGVDRVAAQQVGLGRLDRAGAVLRRTTGGAGRRVGGEVDLDLGVRGHHRADVAALDDDAAVADDRALQLEQPLRAPPGTEATALTWSVTSWERIALGDVGAVDGDRGVCGVGAGHELGLVGARGDRRRVVEVDAVLEHPGGHRAELGAGVEVAQARAASRHPRDVLDLPDPDGPSIATTTLLTHGVLTALNSRCLDSSSRGTNPTGG